METAKRESLKPVVVYDGDCPFCLSRIDQIRRLDTEQGLEYVPRQDLQVEKRLPQIQGIDLEEGLLLVEGDKSVHVGAEALYHIGHYLPSTRPWLWLYKIPAAPFVARIIYKIIAKNRKRLGRVCSTNSCRTPKQ